VDHNPCDLGRQRVYQMALGCDDANDCDSLRSDPVMKMACDRLPVTGDDLDRHFSMPEVHDYCEDHDLYYVFDQAGNARRNALGAPLLDQAKMLAQDKDGKVRLFSSFSYQAGSWRIQRRVVFKTEITECGPDPRYVVTNLTSTRPSFIYEKVYFGRMEGYIKNHKNGLQSDRISCHEIDPSGSVTPHFNTL